MTKKHFNELAKQLAIVRREIVDDHAIDAIQMWEECVNAVVRACRNSNPRFDAYRFRDACYK